MKIVQRLLLSCVIAATLPSARVLAHHSFSAEFDRKQPITLTGVVTRLEWQNPHTRLYLEVKDSTGQVVPWELELASPNGLMRAACTRHAVQAGDKITVKGFLAKDGSHLANAANVRGEDGRTILSETTINESKD